MIKQEIIRDGEFNIIEEKSFIDNICVEHFKYNKIGELIYIKNSFFKIEIPPDFNILKEKVTSRFGKVFINYIENATLKIRSIEEVTLRKEGKVICYINVFGRRMTLSYSSWEYLVNTCNLPLDEIIDEIEVILNHYFNLRYTTPANII